MTQLVSIRNKNNNKAVIAVTGAGTATVTIPQLLSAEEIANSTAITAAGGTPTQPTQSNIQSISWSTSGSISIQRGSNEVLNLSQSGDLLLDINYQIMVDDYNTLPYNIVITGGGSVVMKVTKA